MLLCKPKRLKDNKIKTTAVEKTLILLSYKTVNLKIKTTAVEWTLMLLSDKTVNLKIKTTAVERTLINWTPCCYHIQNLAVEGS